MQWAHSDDTGQINNTTRSLIRRHAAKGHNLGRKINRPSRVKAFERRGQQQTTRSNSSTSPCKHAIQCVRHGHAFEGESMPSRIEPPIGDGISVLNLCIEVAPEDRGLMFEAVSFMRSPRYVPSLAKALKANAAGDSMFEKLLFLDQAYYHFALAVVAECTEYPSPQRASIHHITKSFHLLNERISEHGEVTTSTLALVMALSVYHATQGRHEQGLVHLQGLSRMIEMRGGLQHVGSQEPQLLTKICRTTLDYALRATTVPQLGSDLFTDETRMNGFNLSIDRPLPVCCLLNCGDFGKRLGLELCHLWHQAIHLAALANDACAGKHPRLHCDRFMHSYLCLGHRLLKIASLGNLASLDRTQRLAHLGLATFVSSFLCGLDRRILENKLLSRSIRVEARNVPKAGDEEPFLWLLFLAGAIMLKDPAHDVWLVPTAWSITQDLKLNTWNDTRDTLMKYPWINDYYESSAAALFQRVVFYGGQRMKYP